MSLPNLRDTLNDHFNKDELHQLCLDLNIEYENLSGDTRRAKAQSLVEYCLRHGRLPDLVQRCHELRPAANCPDAASVSTITAEWQKIQQAISAQEDLQGILPAEQTAPLLAALRQKETEIVAQLIGGDVVAGDKVGGDKVAGDKIIGQIINIYREGGGQVPDEQLRGTIAAYASWVIETYGRIPLRGLNDREYDLPDPDLSDVYVSLAAQGELAHRREPDKEREPVDMGSLLNQGRRPAGTGDTSPRDAEKGCQPLGGAAHRPPPDSAAPPTRPGRPYLEPTGRPPPRRGRGGAGWAAAAGYRLGA